MQGLNHSSQAERHGLLCLKVDMSLYWLRRMYEQVFGHIAKRRRILQAKTGDGAIVLLLLLLAECNIIALWRSTKLQEQFIPA